MKQDTERLRRLADLGLGQYLHLRQLQDGTVIAIGPLLGGIGLYIDMDEETPGRRYMYDDGTKAMEAYLKQSNADEIPYGFIDVVGVRARDLRPS